MAFVRIVKIPILQMIIIFIILACFIFSSPQYSDSVILKNGTEYRDVDIDLEKDSIFLNPKCNFSQKKVGIEIKKSLIETIHFYDNCCYCSLHQNKEVNRGIQQTEKEADSNVSSKTTSKERKNTSTSRVQSSKPFSWRWVVPGWEQYHREEKNKGNMIIGSMLGFSLLWLYFDNEYYNSQADYNATEDIRLRGYVFPSLSLAAAFDSYFQSQDAVSDMKTYGNYAQISSFLVAAVYLYNILDGIFVDNLYAESKEGYNVHFSMKPEANVLERGFNVNFSYEFRF